MGDVIPFPASRIVHEQTLTKRQLARELGYSTRWIEIRKRDDGLPFERERNGSTRYRLSDVLAWLDERPSA